MPKHKADRRSDHADTKHVPPTCIIHLLSIADHGHFTPLSEIKGTADDKLRQLHQIRDRRMCVSHDSPLRMQSVCDQIPTTLPDDMTNVGYHRQCYQRLRANLHRLPIMSKQASQRPHNGTTPLVNCVKQAPQYNFSHPNAFFVTKWRSRVLVVKLRELKYSHRGRKKKTDGSRSNHGLRKWV